MEALAQKSAGGLKGLAKEFCPPIAWRGLHQLKMAVHGKFPPSVRVGHPGGQDLDVYWDKEMAELLETWGEGNVWNEIQMFLFQASGRVMDIACGTGKTMEVLARFPRLEITGCDISDMLISKARERGIAAERLRVADATKLDFPNNYFDYSYSIGSFEHFTEDGLAAVIAESARVSRVAAFHMVPVSRSGRDEGWMKTYQSFFNNSPEWWTKKYLQSFARVIALDSAWNDSISFGKWFVCYKDGA